MYVFKHSTRIDASPEKVFEWLGDLPEHYRSWHPEHVVARWIKKTDEGVGSVFYAEQFLGGKKAPYTFTVTKYVPCELIEYTAAFPQSILFPGGSFIVEADGQGSIFTATLTFRFGFLCKLFSKKMGYVRKHVAEEGENLRRLLEQGTR